MIRAAVRELRAHAARVAMTVLTIAFGVAFVVGSWVLGDSTQRAMLGADHRTDFDVIVGGGQGLDLGDRELATVRSQPGVAAAVGVVRGYASVIGRGGKVVGSGQLGGISWNGKQNLQLTAGRAPDGAGEVALNERTARDAGLAVGDPAGVMLERGRRELRVVGLFAYQPLGIDLDPGLAFDPATARELVGPHYTSIEVTASRGVEPRRLAEQLVAVLPEAYVETRADIIADIRTFASKEAAALRAFLLGFAALVLLVGSFLIVNTFAVLATARTRQYALLRAVGASPGQVRRGVLVEAALLGLVGSSIGVALGLGSSYTGVYLLRPPGDVIRFAVSPIAVLVGYAVGVLTTVAAGYGSARRSASVAPVVALRADLRVCARSLRGRRRLGLALLTIGLVAVLGTGGAGLSDVEVAVAVAGAVSIMTAVLILTPVVLPLVLRPVERIAVRARATGLRLAVRNAARDPRRSAATASALVIGIALVSATGTVGASMVADLTEHTRRALPPSTVVVQSSDQGSSLGPDAMAAANGVPGRGPVVALRGGSATIDFHGTEHDVWVSAVDPAGIGTVVRPTMLRGRADVRTGVVLPAKVADVVGADVGATLSIRVGEGDGAVPVRVAVTGVYRDDDVVGGVLIAQSLAQALPERYRAIFLGPAEGRTATELRTATERAFAGQPHAVVTDVSGLLDDMVDDVGLDLALLYGLLVAAVLVAVAGVVNTMVLAVLERTGELGLLRAVGAEQRLVRRTVRWEAVVLCGAGGLLGLAVGLPLGAVFQHLALDRPLWALTVPWSMVAAILAGLLVAGVLAAAWPARRAAGTAPLAAIAAAG